ncbi:MAG: hypothetical protein MZV70_07050 [Desulfobacterales bacterium]|nr:hypothetical protein [Desulfobacterales bacterium]
MRRLICLLLLIFALLATFALPHRARSIATYTFNVDVTTDSVDSNPADGICSDAGGSFALCGRAIIEANSLPAATVTIHVPAGTYNGTPSHPAPRKTVQPATIWMLSTAALPSLWVRERGRDVIINAVTIAHRIFDVRSRRESYAQ